MATSKEKIPSLGSYDTALCIMPPSHLTDDISRLRSMYDKGYGRWPAHINLLYPFVAPESLPQATQLLKSTLTNQKTNGIRLRLDKADFFAHKRSNTIYLTNSGSEGSWSLVQLQHSLVEAFNGGDPGTLHLTIGQSEADDLPQRQYLLNKVALIPAVEWEVEELTILVRDRSQGLDTTSSPMVVWGSIPLNKKPSLSGLVAEVDADADAEPELALSETRAISPASQAGVTFHFSPEEEGRWIPLTPSQTQMEVKDEEVMEGEVTIASYNVLIDSPHPPPTERYPILQQNILSDNATADLLILQEVADEFLSFLLRDPQIRLRYPFTTHGPPDQADLSPLTSLRNIVVLSRYPFRWDWLPFEKRHKGAVILQLTPSLGSGDENLIVAGVHLTCGLADGSILAKRSQLQTILRYLSKHHSASPWVVAGDFNIPTSSFTIDTAVKRKSISAQAASILSSLDGMIAEAGLADCYFAARAGGFSTEAWTGEALALYEGEEGATFDPTKNELAARIAGQSFHSRPQRYDRVLVRSAHQRVQVCRFNQFGFPLSNQTQEQGREEEEQIGSDHWGVRATFKLGTAATKLDTESESAIEIVRAETTLGRQRLTECLDSHNAIPSPEQIQHRRQVFDLVRDLINQRDPNLPSDTRVNLSFVLVPVGSYALNVWTPSSDIDVLVIGPVSPRTFFALTIAKLRRAGEESEIVILRKVKAASGTMLELSCRGIRLDLQYCAATRVSETWPDALSAPVDDPIFDLPLQSLLKLNSFRDMVYLQRTLPSIPSFRVAYRVIKLWAQCRGIYSAKLGYLGGVHISLLLSRVCKLASRAESDTSTYDLLATFFRYYTSFSWAKEMVYDQEFYPNRPRYFRSAREPLVVLSQHAPKVNVARAATVPSCRTLEQEFKRADEIFSSSSTSSSLEEKDREVWDSLLGQSSGAEEFLASYPSYAKVNVQYWGSTMRGRMLVGWLEWRCVSLLVEINRKFPDIHARIWPARFTDQPKEEDEDEGKEYQGCYLIGLTKSTSTRPLSPADKQSAQIALVSILNGFAEEIRKDEKYFDVSSSWVDASLVTGSGVQGLRLDDSEWGTPTTYDSFDSDDEDDIDFDDQEEEEEDRVLPRRPRHQTAPGAGTSTSVGGPKLRPASDILSRLRWDSNIDIEDYIVGYEDRFLGEREMAVGQWKAELTDEAFIPMHRILYFRRRSDGVRVWDREKKADLIFGSGLSPSTEE